MHAGGQDGRLSLELLADLADVSPDLLCALDRRGRFVAVNPAWERVVGWPPQELIGRWFGDFLDNREQARSRSHWVERILAGEAVADLEAPWPHREGGHRWISWSANPGADTDLLYFSGRDVTDRAERFTKVAHEAGLLAEAERAAGIGVWDWDVDEDDAYLSAGACRLLGLPPEERLRLTWLLDMVDPDDRDRFEKAVRTAVAAGTSFDEEFRVRRADGTEVVIWERGHAVVLDGRVVRLYGTVKDVTEQRRIEEGLRRTAELEQAAADRLRRVDLLKTSFLSAVSHELRTPMTVIHGMAETLQRTRDGLTPDARRPLEDALVRHTGQFSALLSDLLDVDRLLRGRVETSPEPLDVARLVRSVTTSSAVAERAELRLPETLRAQVDRVQVERILANLLDNARKYAPAGTVTVALERLERGGFVLSVADEGPGLHADELRRVFEPFYRSSERSPQPGTGIGLALVASFAALHGGRAWAEAVAPRGVRFCVEVPTDDLDGAPVLFDGDGHV